MTLRGCEGLRAIQLVTVLLYTGRALLQRRHEDGDGEKNDDSDDDVSPALFKMEILLTMEDDVFMENSYSNITTFHSAKKSI